MAQQSARRGRENQCFPQCFEHALGEMDQARELPYRPAAQHRIRGRTDGSIRLRTTTIPKFSLATKGASTDGERSFAARARDEVVALIPVVPRGVGQLARSTQRGRSCSPKALGADARGLAISTLYCRDRQYAMTWGCGRTSPETIAKMRSPPKTPVNTQPRLKIVRGL